MARLNRAPGPSGRFPASTPPIPRLIHQTAPTRGSLLPEVEANIEANMSRNPGWTHCFYSDADIRTYIGDEYGAGVLGSYDRIDPVYGAARADFFRYLLVYREGGVYLDLKSVATRCLDEVIADDDEYLLSHWPNRPGDSYPGAGLHKELSHLPRGEYQQWFIVATPGHPFLDAVIENVIRNLAVYDPLLHGVGGRGVFRVTGPIAYTIAIDGERPHRRHRLVDNEADLGLEYSFMHAEGRGAHKRLLPRHYSQGLEPIVRPDGLHRHTGPLVRTVNRVRNRLTKP